MARKLVTIQQIKDTFEIPGADVIEGVSFVDIGWKCVSQKGGFKPGDKCVYFEIDSFLPEEERYEFLRGCCYRTMYTGHKGFRLKTIQLKGQVSQGLALPLSSFPEFKDFEVGTDVTEATGVIKYEIDPESGFEAIGVFPGYVSKSDQIRIQTLLEYFEKYQDTEFEETMKLDGQSVTLSLFEKDLKVCGRNQELKQQITVAPWQVVRRKELDVALRELNLDIALQFELMGPKIQGNREKLTTLELYLYNIYDIRKSRFFKPSERYEIFEELDDKVFSLSGEHLLHTPILNKKVKIFQEASSLEALLERATGKSLFHLIREGNVYKSLEYLTYEEVLQFKVISNLFLLKGGH